MSTETLRDQIISNGNIPSHIAIIMDGNGRWAKERRLPRFAGHSEGINSVREITRVCGGLGVKHLTLYTFSFENWSRPKKEVSALMQLLLKTIRKEISDLDKNNVKLTTIGSLDDLPSEARQGILDGIEQTKSNTGLNLILALSYGGRQEILSAVKTMCKDLESGKLKLESVSEDIFKSYLYTSNIPDPELLIRTGGERRISNFLLWQIAYSEIYITDVYWPGFREKELYLSIQDYQERERRFGKVSEQLQKENN
ncbi:MAG: isoprenyl transferase [Candidatus Marinimicrobia bacterium]|nr:isoprenyl transferase [Candidatus Neomarinimicrobiota bacterium]MCH7763512.1 isoprenyl transferase [Candidatus Neomarinimicrobiota bacterium]